MTGESDEACRVRIFRHLAEQDRSIPALDFFSGSGAIDSVVEVVEFMKRGSFAIE